MKAEKKYLKTGEAADYIGIHPQTLRNYHAEGLLIPEIILDIFFIIFSLIIYITLIDLLLPKVLH